MRSSRPSVSIRFVGLCLFFAFAVFACLAVDEDLAGVLGVAGGVVGVFITGQAMRPSGRPFPWGGCAAVDSADPQERESASISPRRIESEG